MSTSNAELARTALDDYILDIAWLPQVDQIVIGDSSGLLQVLDVTHSEVIHEWQAHDGMLSCATNTKQPLTLTGGQDGQFKLWNTQTFELIASHASGTAWSECAVWSPDGQYCVVGTGPRIALIHANGSLVYRSERHESTVSSISWHPESSSFATACFGGVRIFGLSNSEPIQFMSWKNSMISLSWSPDGKFIGCGTQDARIHFFPLPYQKGEDFEMSGYQGKVKILDWDHRAQYLLTNCGTEIVVWPFAGKAPTDLVPWTLDDHRHKVTAIRNQHQGNCFVSADDGGSIRFYRSEGEDLYNYGGYNTGVSITCLTWSPDDQLLALGTTSGEVLVMTAPNSNRIHFLSHS